MLWLKTYLCSSGAMTCSSGSCCPSLPASLVLHYGTRRRRHRHWIGEMRSASSTSLAPSPEPRCEGRYHHIPLEDQSPTDLLTGNFRQPNHEFTFNVGIDLLF
jgi:hypothetical protein